MHVESHIPVRGGHSALDKGAVDEPRSGVRGVVTWVKDIDQGREVVAVEPLLPPSLEDCLDRVLQGQVGPERGSYREQGFAALAPSLDRRLVFFRAAISNRLNKAGLLAAN